MANGTIAASQLEMLTQSGTGIITIVPPATNTNRTLTLPDSNGTMATAESTLTQFNASGSAPVYACRAWVNFNGTGTVAIRASGNVSSITDGGVGIYTVNFTTALPDASYSTNITLDGGNAYIGTINNQTTSSVSVYGWTTASAFFDATRVCVSIFR